MKVTDKTPTTQISIAEQNVTIPQPFAAGQKITENEAAALNQLLAENVRNNLRERVKKLIDDGKPNEVQATVNEYVQGYEFGARGGGRVTDPVEHEAIEIATRKIKEHLAAQNLKVSDYKASDIRQLALQVVEQNPAIREEAQRIVDQRKQVAEGLAGGLDLSKLSKKEPKAVDDEAEAA